MKLRERIIEEVKEIKAEPLMQKTPAAAIDLVEDNYPEVLDYISQEGRIAGLFRALELLEITKHSYDVQDNSNTDAKGGEE